MGKDNVTWLREGIGMREKYLPGAKNTSDRLKFGKPNGKDRQMLVLHLSTARRSFVFGSSQQRARLQVSVFFLVSCCLFARFFYLLKAPVSLPCISS